MLKKILIANRGEIAVRIARTAKDMGISTVSVYAGDDTGSWHVQACDESFGLGTGELADTYLNIPKIIDIAKAAGCDAIHPGYGFLSENAAFSHACTENDLVFIGPSAEVIRLMGNKQEANHYVRSLGIPVLDSVPVSENFDHMQGSVFHFPVLIKAAAGGGGKGMRIVKDRSELKSAVESASRESETAFGDGTVYIEKLLQSPRHIEVQVLGDNFGKIVHLFDRECSLQRRYQKVVEEAPSPTLTNALRKKIINAALKIAKSVSYSGAGTIEFLLGDKGEFYFLEMNTRIQVEHPVTEMITGIDIVREQLLIASDYSLSFEQEDITINGHAIEARIYAEDPCDSFRPSPGKILFWRYPVSNDLRVDTGILSGYELKHHYDPMVAKIISHGTDREQALNNLLDGLSHIVLHGIDNNLVFLKTLVADKNYLRNKISTTYIEENLVRLNSCYSSAVSPNNRLFLLAAAVIFKLFRNNSPGPEFLTAWQNIGFWRHLILLPLELHNIYYEVEVYQQGRHSFLLFLNGQVSEMQYPELSEHLIRFVLAGVSYQMEFSATPDGEIWLTGMQQTVVVKRKDILSKQQIPVPDLYFSEESKIVVSPMHGKILKVLVSENCEINKNDTLLIIDSMKTENRIIAPSSGVIGKLYVSEGDQVKTNSLLAEIY
ncbi:MAG: biotin carboxylase N-terminal domain-containing protein [Bacteroidales bacterium]